MSNIRDAWAGAARALPMALLLFCASPLLAQEDDDPWLGPWIAAEVRMYVLASDGDGRYEGFFAVEGGLLPFTARTFWGVGLRGTYTLAGTETTFEAMRAGGRLVLADPNSRVVLSRSDEPVPAEVLAALRQADHDPATAPGSDGSAAPGADGTPASYADLPADDEEYGDPYAGFRFTSMSGWRGTPNADGYLFQSATTAGTILVLPHERRSLDELRSDAEAGLSEGSVDLRLAGALKSHGSNGLRAAVAGTIEGQAVKGRLLTLLSPHGGGLTLLAVARDVEFGAALEAATEELAGSIEFFVPRTPDAAYEWRERLNDSRLTYLYSYYSGGGGGAYVGASEETIIDLCSAGYFKYGATDSFSADGGGSVGGYDGSTSQGSGNWSVQAGADPVLVLDFHDGTRHEYTLGLNDEDDTLLDGQRYFRTYSNSALAEARPACP